MRKKRLCWLTVATLTGCALLVATWAALQLPGATTAVARSPAAADAAPGDVVINEVAWGGTGASSSDEWIELYNTTDQSVPLAGWRLYAADGGPDIALSGALPPHGFYLIERTDDNAVSDVPADWTGSFGNGLSNAGEGLTLVDELGAVIDTANGDGGAWPGGSGSPDYRSMERIDPLSEDSDDNWTGNDGVTRNGHDAGGQPVNGTPKQPNSALVQPTPLQPDLSVAKTGPTLGQPGQPITYSLRLSNTGRATATAVRLTDTLPSAVTFISQSSGFPVHHSGRHVVWVIGDLPTDTAPLRITVSGQISASASGSLRNVVTATTDTTETLTANNYASWDTALAGGTDEAAVRIGALLYDGYQTTYERDEALQLVNVGQAAADLSGWRLCDAESGGTCATIVSGTLAAQESVWLAHGASEFYTAAGHYPRYAVTGVTTEVLGLDGTWPGYANSGDEAVLRDDEDAIVDTLVYGNGNVWTWGWSGAAVEPWSSDGLFGGEGQILYRALDEASGLPLPDTNSAADWAQYAADPSYGRRVRYPGWDLETFYRPLSVTEQATVTVGVAPDNAAEVVLETIDAAQSRIEIAVYGLRHPTVISQLVAKAGAGVTVTVLLEGDPVGLSKSDPRWYQEMWACQQLHATGHGACWFMVNRDEADVSDRYRYMHAKYMLVDRELALITSQNLTASSMPDDDRSNGTYGSRGVVLVTDAPSVVSRVAELVDHDLDPAHHADLQLWSDGDADYGPPPPDYSPALSVTDHTTYTVAFSQPLTIAGSFGFELFSAPEAALRQSDALLGLLARAGDGDRVYVEQLDERAQWGDDPVADPSLRMAAYLAAARRGARVRILLNGGRFGAEYTDNSNNEAAVAYANQLAQQEGLDLLAATGDPTQYGIHNKMVLVWLADAGGHVHVGSLNGSETSSKANRELALQVRSDAVYGYLKAVFDWDWYKSQPIYLPVIARGWQPPAPPVGYPVISELLYNPSGAEDGGEWVELFNPTGQAVDLSGWHLGDVGPTGEYGSGLYTFPADTVLPAGDVLLVARQAQDIAGFTPDLEFLIDPLRDDGDVPNMVPAGGWDGFGFALGNGGDEVILLDADGDPVDALVYGAGSYPGVVPHPGVSGGGRSLERRPAIYDTDDCSLDFVERYPPDPGNVDQE